MIEPFEVKDHVDDEEFEQVLIKEIGHQVELEGPHDDFEDMEEEKDLIYKNNKFDRINTQQHEHNHSPMNSPLKQIYDDDFDAV